MISTNKPRVTQDLILSGERVPYRKLQHLLINPSTQRPLRLRELSNCSTQRSPFFVLMYLSGNSDGKTAQQMKIHRATVCRDNGFRAFRKLTSEFALQKNKPSLKPQRTHSTTKEIIKFRRRLALHCRIEFPLWFKFEKYYSSPTGRRRSTQEHRAYLWSVCEALLWLCSKHAQDILDQLPSVTSPSSDQRLILWLPGGQLCLLDVAVEWYQSRKVKPVRYSLVIKDINQLHPGACSQAELA